MSKEKPAPKGLEPLAHEARINDLNALARQLASGQPLTHQQYRDLSRAHQALGEGLRHAGEVDEDE